ncbi:GumC family protein [Leptolyngbyaceae cyanobacterium UHCC 1019]
MNKVGAIVARHWLPLVVLNSVVAAIAVFVATTSVREWTSSAQLILPASSSNLEANLGTLGSLKNSDLNFSPQLNPLKVQQSILTSEALLDATWLSDPQNKPGDKPRDYAKFFKVAPQEQTTIMRLTVTGASPEVAKQRAASLIKAYQNRLNELRRVNNEERSQFSRKQREDAQIRLADAQKALAEFKETTGLVSSDEQIKGVVQTLNAITTVQAQAQAQAQASSDRAKFLSSRLGMNSKRAIQSIDLGENQDYLTVRRRLTEIEVSLAKLQSTYTEAMPRFQRLREERDALQQQLQGYIAQASGNTQGDANLTASTAGRATLIQQLVLAEGEAVAQQEQANQLTQKIQQLNSVLRSLPQNQARLFELQRQAEVAEGLYKGLSAQAQQSSIDAFSAYPNVQVLDPPTVDAKPSSPKTSLIAINALLAALLGSAALVLLLEARNPLLSPKDLHAIEFPFVVSIPRLKSANLGLKLNTEHPAEFQRLASTVSLQPLKNRSLLVTSAMMGEGKTTVTLGLAIALADLGFRVLIVDGDFQRAGLSSQFGQGHTSSIDNKFIKIQPNLDLMPTLPQSGRFMDIATRGKFERSLADIQSTNDYDYILVDSAPVSQSTETAMMATIVSNVLLVIRPGESLRNPVNDSLGELAQHSAKLIGLVINAVNTKSVPYTHLSNTHLSSETLVKT